jgi:hypothetical protein
VTMLPQTVEEMEALILGMPANDRKALEQKVTTFLKDKPWVPQPGPQTLAYYSEADELLYGGAVGGGKSDLLLGLASVEHRRSIIFRRQSTDLEKMWARLTEQILPGRVVKQNASTKKLRTGDQRFIEFGHLEKPGSEQGHQGNDHDFYGFDEAAQLDEFKVSFVIQWLRSTVEGQRKRVVFATNPPIPEYKDGKLVDTGTGAWLKEWFAPWLEDMFPDPAKPGELRWCYMRTEGDRLITVWVEGPGRYHPDTGEPWPDATQDDIDKGRAAAAKSRTFIKALLNDNIYLKNTGYAAQLSATPEPLKTLLLTGSFTVKGEDHPFQVISTMDVLRAQQRWRDRVAKGEHKNLRQLVLFGDVAQGGADTTVLAPLMETDFFGELVTQAGRLTPTGKEVCRMLLDNRENASLIGLDGTGGWAGSTKAYLELQHKIIAELLISSEKSFGWTEDQRYKFANLRTEFWWAMRLALDIKSGYEICLPPSTRLLTQLTAPQFKIKGNVLYIEEKEDLRKRIGSSTDEADAVLGAWYYRDEALARWANRQPDIVSRIVHGKKSTVSEAELSHQAMELDDPLKEWR